MTLKMLQIGNEANKLTPVTKNWNWKKSFTQTDTSLEGDALKLLTDCASLNVRSKSGSRTGVQSGKKKMETPSLMAVMALMALTALMTHRQNPNSN